MIVSHLILKNWRNFQVVDASLQERVFLVGPNASGKSNLLDVFRFLRDIAKDGGGLQKAVADRGRLPKIQCLCQEMITEKEIETIITSRCQDAKMSSKAEYQSGLRATFYLRDSRNHGQ